MFRVADLNLKFTLEFPLMYVHGILIKYFVMLYLCIIQLSEIVIEVLWIASDVL